MVGKNKAMKPDVLGNLVSWNYRHLANLRKAEGFNAVAVLSGLKAGLQIHTPMEVLE